MSRDRPVGAVQFAVQFSSYVDLDFAGTPYDVRTCAKLPCAKYGHVRSYHMRSTDMCEATTSE
eukprot:scaffold38451_cov41-Cyclotella_meneghiniana.AAC.3